MRQTQWTKAKETLKEMILSDIAEYKGDIKDYETLKKAALNGADDFKQASYDGNYLIYNYELAQLFCTPKQLEKLENRKQFPQGINGQSWLDIQARALIQCFREIAKDRGYKIPSIFNK